MIRRDHVAHPIQLAQSKSATLGGGTKPAPKKSPPTRPKTAEGPSHRAAARPRSSRRTEKLAANVHDMDQRRRLFNKLGCQDMKGLLVTDRGLAVHINRLAKELDVQVPTYPFIPEPPHVSQKVRS